jgi:hypothetical protein
LTACIGPRAIARLQPARGTWSPEVRTPLGLVDEGDGTYTVFYTGFEQAPDWTRLMESKPVNTFAVGFARVKITSPGSGRQAIRSDAPQAGLIRA